MAQEIAKAFSAKIHLLHVVLDPHAQGWSLEGTGVNLGSLRDTCVEEAERQLATLEVVDASPTRVTKVGQPSTEITSYAKEQDIDLIVMGTHGHGPIGEMLIGSVADKVVRTAPCPVLTVRHPDA